MHDHAAAQRKYRMTTKGRAYQQRFSKSPKGKYDKHKQRAKARGIDWMFTFETWWNLWEPFFDNMGQTPTSYHMCRRLDEGPYSPENCYIDTAANNGRDATVTKKRRAGGE